jgi:protein SCO1
MKHHFFLLLIVAAFVAGCDKHSHAASRRSPGISTNVSTYQVKGVLKNIRTNGSRALIAHEDIPGYMQAMTVEFDVRDTNELVNLQPGDPITFRMLVTDTDGWIDHVQRIGAGTASAAQPALAVIVDELKPGAPLPDYVLTNHLGQAIHLSGFKGQALAFTFIFTRCPFPTYCPRISHNFGDVQRQLQEAKTGTNWHLVSVSFDPEFDAPERLAAYAQTYGCDAAHWSFATSTTEEVRQLGSKFGLAFWREGASFNHNVRTVVVDAAGRVQKVFTDNEWKPAELVEEMKKAMEVKP